MRRSDLLRATILTILLCCVSVPALANGPLRSILVRGNDNTERTTILQIIGVKKGDYITRKVVTEVDGRLHNCGLFKNIRVKRRKNRDGSYDLVIHVSEKTTWFIVPLVQAWSGRYSGGLIFGESNFLGANKRTLLVVNYGNAVGVVFFAYQDRHLFGTDYTLRVDTIARTDDTPVYAGNTGTELGNVEVRDLGFVVYPGYQWTRNIETVLAVDYRRVWFEDTNLIALPETSNDVAMRFEFIYNSIKRRDFRLKGTKLKASFEFADERLGSDFEYTQEALEMQGAFVFGEYVNWITAFEGKLAQDRPFHRQITLGGSSLRGYADREFRGDTLIKYSNELYFPIYSNKTLALRGLVFYDVGLLYFDENGIDRDDFNSGTGGGFRVSLKNIVAPFVGLDVAYGLESKNTEIYFALGLVQF